MSIEYLAIPISLVEDPRWQREIIVCGYERASTDEINNSLSLRRICNELEATGEFQLGEPWGRNGTKDRLLTILDKATDTFMMAEFRMASSSDEDRVRNEFQFRNPAPGALARVLRGLAKLTGPLAVFSELGDWAVVDQETKDIAWSSMVV